MMKTVVLTALLAVSLYASGSSEMGKTIYHNIFKSELGYIGDTFTAKYTIKEWEEMFEDDAKAFKKEFGVTPALQELFDSQRFESFLPHIKAFTIEYAKDSGYVPNCIEFTSRGQDWDD